jgi:hypothetical protein
MPGDTYEQLTLLTERGYTLTCLLEMGIERGRRKRERRALRRMGGFPPRSFTSLPQNT